MAWYTQLLSMENRLPIPFCLFLVLGITLFSPGAWSSPGETVKPVKDETIAGAPVPPASSTPQRGDRFLNVQKNSVWEKRFFDEPLSPFQFSKSPLSLSNGSGIPLKSPGKLPGIEFGVEMHSLEALQSVVPQEHLPKSLSAQQDQPLLLSPSNLTPDYNGGFLRFTW